MIFFEKNITPHQAKDTGMAIVLICLLVGMFKHSAGSYTLATILLVLAMIQPALFKPAAKVWFGFSRVVGVFGSRILFSVVFFLVLTPIGLLRRVFGFDSLQLKKWKKDHTSVFKTRDSVYMKTDIEAPY